MAIHGKWQVANLPNQVLVSRIEGSFSKQRVAQYCQHVHKEAEMFNGKPWIHICDARKFELGVPEALPIAQNSNQWAIEHGRVLRLYLTENSIQEFLFKKFRGDDAHFFNSIESLCRFLEDQKFEFNKSDITHWFYYAETVASTHKGT